MNRNQIIKGIQHPIKAFDYIKKLFKGTYYRAICKCTGKRVTIGKYLKVKGRLSIKGPGAVAIGNNVFIDGTSHTVTPWTYSKEAIISIGDNVYLNGTRFGCKMSIDIGNNCIIADCRILDVDHHSIIPSRRNDQNAIKSAPIKIGNNVWIAMDCAILKGVKIGDNTTITAKSVVMHDLPANCICGGNPAKIIRELSKEELVE